MMDLQRVNEYMSRVEESEKKVLPHAGRLKTGLDLGTAYIVLVVLDEKNQPVACEKKAADVLRDGVVVDYSGACRIVKELKDRLEERLGEELTDCAIAMPAGTESSVQTHRYVAESAGFEVTNVLDEPTAGLDPKGRDEILDQIRLMQRERGITVVLVSHSMEDVAEYVDRILVMSGGRLVFDDTPARVFSRYKELEEIGLASPQVTYVVKALQEKGWKIDGDVTTVRDAKEAILKALSLRANGEI